MDLRAALRALAARPGYAIASTLTLALAIGANSTVFAVVDAVLLKAIPFPEPDRLVMVWETVPDQGESEAFLSYPSFRQWVDARDLTFIVLHDREGRFERSFQTVGVPESFVIDRRGMLVAREIGPRMWDSPEYGGITSPF